MGIMFLKGEYVDQSLAIAIGMAWLGVAGEADQDDWHATYKQIYETLPANLQAVVDAKLATYIELYGVRTQKIRCARRARTGQRRIEEICGKNGSDTPCIRWKVCQRISCPESEPVTSRGHVNSAHCISKQNTWIFAI